MRVLGLGQVSRVVEALTRLEQVAREPGCAKVDAEAFDHATAVYDGAARLPERATVARACLDRTLGDEAKLAGVRLDLAHGRSVRRGAATAIGRRTDLRCGLLPRNTKTARERSSCGGPAPLRGNHPAPVACSRVYVAR